MFVFGDAARLVWQARQTHKFLVHKFLRLYFCHRHAWNRHRTEGRGHGTQHKDYREPLGDDRELILLGFRYHLYFLAVGKSSASNLITLYAVSSYVICNFFMEELITHQELMSPPGLAALCSQRAGPLKTPDFEQIHQKLVNLLVSELLSFLRYLELCVHILSLASSVLPDV